MTNLERLRMSIEGINIEDNKLLIYLEENNLTSTDNYNPQSNTNKKQILKTSNMQVTSIPLISAIRVI